LNRPPGPPPLPRSRRADTSAALCLPLPVKGPSELKLDIEIATDKTILELKEAIAAKSDVEKERQRLIYSGTWPSTPAFSVELADPAVWEWSRSAHGSTWKLRRSCVA
jgi:hypothetical protein